MAGLMPGDYTPLPALPRSRIGSFSLSPTGHLEDAFRMIRTIRSDAAATERAIWELVARGWPEEERGGQLETMARLVSAGKGDSLVVLAAYADERLVGGAFAQMLPGRAAVITPPQIFENSAYGAAAIEDALLAAVEKELRAGGMHLAQCLLPFGDSGAAATIRRTGFTHSADLLYLVASSESFREAPLKQPFELEPWNPADQSRLIRILDETYAGTLDCPEIDGLRDTADVLRGYLGTGEQRPGLWQIVREQGRDVGCLLLAFHSAGPHCELVYVGLVPAVRGRGWGIELTRHAQWLAREAGAERLVLAVDASNEPAVRMYVAAGFAAWDRRQLWIKSQKSRSDCG